MANWTTIITCIGLGWLVLFLEVSSLSGFIFLLILAVFMFLSPLIHPIFKAKD
ncbi:hypothetical protein [Pseudoalteromonas galatheae]|uniref:hypothetical protein n=1 Tax=Pseudoalteromonas galatheae TaxID=579562 RepID=UPI0030D28145